METHHGQWLNDLVTNEFKDQPKGQEKINDEFCTLEKDLNHMWSTLKRQEQNLKRHPIRIESEKASVL